MINSVWAICSGHEEKVLEAARGIFSKALTDSLDIENEGDFTVDQQNGQKEKECIFYTNIAQNNIIDMNNLFDFVLKKIKNTDQDPCCGALFGSGPFTLQGVPMIGKSQKDLTLSATQKQIDEAKEIAKKVNVKVPEEVQNSLIEYYKNLPTTSIDPNNEERKKKLLSATFIDLNLFISKKEIKRHRKKENEDAVYKEGIEKKELEKIQLSEIWEKCENKTEGTIRIMIKGKAGVGKSTLSKVICQRFYCGQLWKEKFSVIAHLSLKELATYSQDTNIHSFYSHIAKNCILENESYKTFLKDTSVISYLEKIDEEGKLVWIFDGFDELEILSEGKQTNISKNATKILHMLKENMVTKKFRNIIITTRPEISKIPHDISLNLDIDGFSNSSKRKFIENYFERNFSNKEKLLDLMKNNSVIANSMKIPLYVEMICFCIDDENKKLIEKNLKIGTIYEEIINKLIQLNIERKREIAPEIYSGHSTDLCKLIKKLLSLVAKYTIENEQFYISKQEMEKISNDYVFIGNFRYDFEILNQIGKFPPDNATKCLSNSGLLTQVGDGYHFIHFSFQEFLFSIEISNELTNLFKFGKLISAIKKNWFWNSMIPQFICFSIKDNPRLVYKYLKGLFGGIISKNLREDGKSAVTISQCLTESFSENTANIIFGFIKSLDTMWKNKILFEFGNNKEIVETLSRRNFYHSEVKDGNGMTSLHFACMNENINVEIIKLLLENGVDPKIQDKYGETCFHCACKNENINVEIIKLFFEKEIELNVNSDGKTCLHLACMNESVNFEIIKLFFEKGADPNIKDKNGRKSLHFACENEKTTFEIINLFLQKKADPNLMDGYERSCLHYALLNKEIKSDVIALLLVKGVDPNQRDVNEKTILHLACEHENINIEIIKLFLEKGINPNIKDKYGKTSLHYACSNNNISIEIIKLLLNSGADPKIKDKEGKTNLLLAKSNGRSDIVQLLTK